MLHHNGNTIGNNGLQTRGQIEAAHALKKGDKVRLTEEYKAALTRARLIDARDEQVGIIADGGTPNLVFTVDFAGLPRLIHASQLERVTDEA